MAIWHQMWKVSIDVAKSWSYVPLKKVSYSNQYRNTIIRRKNKMFEKIKEKLIKEKEIKLIINLIKLEDNIIWNRVNK